MSSEVIVGINPKNRELVWQLKTDVIMCDWRFLLRYQTVTYRDERKEAISLHVYSDDHFESYKFFIINNEFSIFVSVHESKTLYEGSLKNCIELFKSKYI